ncbi:MAG: hypothetical protein D6832_04335 [Alphaproteobacteria bacterium]|nr:MAG: hypothetical protein D6832_04335 [Alphaproteobacteria bacterium]
MRGMMGPTSREARMTPHQTDSSPAPRGEALLKGSRYAVEHRRLAPGEVGPWQAHLHQQIALVVLAGSVRLDFARSQRLLVEGGGETVPPATGYRIVNPGRIPALLLVVRHGSYIGEDDLWPALTAGAAPEAPEEEAAAPARGAA